jgi:tRNA pseudouridine55 synthase
MRLGCGATLTELTREYSHPFGLEQACSLEAVLDNPESLPQRVLPLHAALPDWPVLNVSQKDEADLRNGKPIALASEPAFEPGRRAFLYGADGNPLALAQTQGATGALFWTMLRGLFTA